MFIVALLEMLRSDCLTHLWGLMVNLFGACVPEHTLWISGSPKEAALVFKSFGALPNRVESVSFFSQGAIRAYQSVNDLHRLHFMVVTFQWRRVVGWGREGHEKESQSISGWPSFLKTC